MNINFLPLILTVMSLGCYLKQNFKQQAGYVGETTRGRLDKRQISANK